MSNNSGLDIWGVISGAVGVLTVVPLLCAYLWSQHPETKFAQLDSTLKDTESLLRSVVEEGLLDPERHVTHFELHLNKFRRTTEQYRDETFIASNEWRKLLEAWYNGLPKRISLLCKQVKAVRASICETSANARMGLMQQSREEVVPTHRVWRAKVARLWHRVACLVFKSAPRDTADAPAFASALTPATSTFDEAEEANLSSAEAFVFMRDSLQSESQPGKTPKFSRTTVRTASRDHDLHVLTRAIRRVDRELAAQGVTNALLTQLVQATHKQWSPASSKAHPPRRPRKQGSVSVSPRPRRASTRITLQDASESGIGLDSGDDSSGEETVCEED